MEGNVMNGKAFWDSKGCKTNQECETTRCDQRAHRTLMSALSVVGVVLFIGAVVSPLCAQSYPNKPIHLIIGMAAGGASDTVGRIAAQKLAKSLNQSIVPENRPGAGGNIALNYVVKASPDGYTIACGASPLATAPSLYKKLDYDPIRDFAPISLVAQVPYALVVRSSLPVNSLQELIQYAKANPGKINFASSGIGAFPHLAQEQLKSITKINIVHVPYKGGSEVITALIGGECDMYVGPSSTFLSLIQAGKVKALAVLKNERLPTLPNVPTAKEAGINNWEVSAWFGLLAPAGTPRDIINRLNAEWNRTEAMPQAKEQMQKAGFELLSGTPEQFSEFLKAETIRWGKVIKEAKIPCLD
jgi:tripartite-type tricarboxylate transporter receptor subunit TctC